MILKNLPNILQIGKDCWSKHSGRDPHLNHHIISTMAEDADTKAQRRRRIRDSFVSPLNEIALRHVDSVQALSEEQRVILAQALQKIGMQHLTGCLAAIKAHAPSIKNVDTLVGWLTLSDKSPAANSMEMGGHLERTSEDEDYLAELLVKCYPDMPPTSAEALVASDVMSASLRVVAATRRALEDARSDFVVMTLFTLFEERLHAISQIIGNNPAFIKAIQRSRPDWNTKI